MRDGAVGGTGATISSASASPRPESDAPMSDHASASHSIVLVLASRNRKKCREMAELIVPPWEGNPRLLRLDVRTLDEFPQAPEVLEDADTFAGNARKKAAEVA